MVRADCWRRLGGLDDAFAPAYYEEVDFCLRAKEAGWRVVYEPTAVVRHYEFGDRGRRPRGGAAAAESVADGRAARRTARDQVRAGTGESARGAHGGRLWPSHPRPRRHGAAPVRRQRLSAAAGTPRLLLGQGLEVTFYPTQFPDEDWRVVTEAVPPLVEVMLRLGTAGSKSSWSSGAGSIARCW